MEEKRKPTRWVAWLMAGLVLLVAYPLSYGPVKYVAGRFDVPWLYDAMPVIYAPLEPLRPDEYIERDPLQRAAQLYLQWWASHD